jgi:hypothetical protein
MAVQVLSGKDIGDAIKSAAISYAGAQIPGLDALKEGTSFIKDLGLSPELTKTLTNSFQNAAVSGGTALLSGRNVGDAMLAGAVTGGTSGAVDALMGNIDGFKDLTPAQQRMAINAVSGVVSGKPLDQIVINTAIAAANAEVAKAKGATADQVISPYFTPTTGGLTTTADAGTTGDTTTPPSGLQLAGVDTGTKSDAGSGLTLGGVDAKTQATLDAMKDVDKIGASTTPQDLGEFAGVDKAIAENAAAGTGATGNVNVEQALAQAKAEELKNNIANAPSRSEAFKLAREGLGAGQTFTWNGQSYNTNTAEEAQAIANAKIDALNKANLSTVTDASKTVAAQSDTAAREASAKELAARTSVNNLLAANLGTIGDYFGDNTNATDAAGNLVGGAQGLGTLDTNTALGKAVDTLQSGLGSAVRTGLDVGSGVIKGGGNLAEQVGTLYGNITGDMDNALRTTGADIKASVNAMRSTDYSPGW